MPMPVLFGIGLAASVAGTVFQVAAAQEAAGAQKEVLELQRRAENKRREQMEAEARRRRLEILRDQQRSKSLALANAVTQGADSSTAVPGAYGQIQGQGGVQQQSLQQNLDTGRAIFGINSQITDQQMRIADAQGMSAFGSGISSLGGTLINVMPQMKSLSGQFQSAFGTGQSLTPTFGGAQTSGVPLPRPRPLQYPSYIYGY